MGLLDLSDADTTGFDAIPAGAYNCTVFSVELGETNGSGKLPAGVPMVNVQFAVQDEEYANRRLFNRFALPTKDQHSNAALMQGNFMKFLTALGQDEDKIKKAGGFNPEKLQELVGQACVVRVGYEPYKRDEDSETVMTNPVKSVKPAGSPTGGAQKEGLL